MVFIDNKYTTWYNSIIQKAKSRSFPKNVYSERHHIIPKSIGGNDSADNLVRLTAKEHFICHLLLTKMVEGNQKRSMYHAAWKMVNQARSYQQRYKVNSHTYSLLKERNAKALSESNTGKPSKIKGRIISPEWREKLRQANLGKKRSKESIEKQSKTMTGKTRVFSEEHRLNLKKSKQNISIDTREKLRQANSGRTYVINEELQKCKWIKFCDVDKHLNNGWKLGRKRFSNN